MPLASCPWPDGIPCGYVQLLDAPPPLKQRVREALQDQRRLGLFCDLHDMHDLQYRPKHTLNLSSKTHASSSASSSASTSSAASSGLTSSCLSSTSTGGRSVCVPSAMSLCIRPNAPLRSLLLPESAVAMVTALKHTQQGQGGQGSAVTKGMVRRLVRLPASLQGAVARGSISLEDAASFSATGAHEAAVLHQVL